MAEFYQYQKRRKEFGKPCNFSDTEPKAMGHYPTVQIENPKEAKYVLRNPNFIELDNITELSQHYVNTLRVSTGERGMSHKEGGWPENIDPTETALYMKYMKKLDKDHNFATQVKLLCEAAEKCMLQNKQIDMF